MLRLLLVMLSAHPGIVIGEDGEDVDVDVDEADEADVVVEAEEVIERGITTVMPKGREKKSNWQVRRKAQMPVLVRRGDGLSSQMEDLTLGYEGMLLLRSFKARRKPS